MTFFPAGFDRNGRAVSLFHLVDIDTPDGVFGFLLGANGVFTDVTGKKWYGTTLIAADGLGFGLAGTAKASSFTLSYFQDPTSPDDLITNLRALGSDYIKGRTVRRFIQVFENEAQKYAPVHAPQQFSEMTADHIVIEAPQPLERRITLVVEGLFKVRGGAQWLVYNATDHSRQLGYANPSYELIPTDPREEEAFLS